MSMLKGSLVKTCCADDAPAGAAPTAAALATAVDDGCLCFLYMFLLLLFIKKVCFMIFQPKV